MPQPITEIAFVPLMAGSDLRDSENHAYKIVRWCCNTTARQPGYERGVWGVLGNDPQIWVTITDWDELASHEKFTKTAEHDQELEEIAKICNSPLEVFHVNMTCAGDTTADSKVQSTIMDVVTGYFPVDKAKIIMSKATHGNDYVNGELETGVSPVSFAEGWAIEDEGPVWGTDGTQGARPGKQIEKPWCGVFGWDSATKNAKAQEEYVLQKTRWIEEMGGERVVGRVAFVDYAS